MACSFELFVVKLSVFIPEKKERKELSWTVQYMDEEEERWFWVNWGLVQGLMLKDLAEF